MRKLLALLATTVCMFSYCGMNAFGQQASYYYFVGATSTKTTGLIKGGLAGMNNLCRSQFNKETHMCSADEFFSSAPTAANNKVVVWIQPALHGCVYNGSAIMCQEGGSSSFVPATNAALACQNGGNPWTSNSATNNGTSAAFTTATGFQLDTSTACNESHPVACCAPAD
ncbi:MAG: hypothetical protein P4L55_22940 [Syntrophobacteraceae bacterium]|nr:hypothetical protein [Syntrophobacteraceae bacterium]